MTKNKRMRNNEIEKKIIQVWKEKKKNNEKKRTMKEKRKLERRDNKMGNIRQERNTQKNNKIKKKERVTEVEELNDVCIQRNYQIFSKEEKQHEGKIAEEKKLKE